MLVDTGGLPRWVHSDLDIGEDVVSPYLWSRSISRLDAVAITPQAVAWRRAAILADSGRASCGWAICWSQNIPSVTGGVVGVRVVHRQAGENFDFGVARDQRACASVRSS